jgi:hypothetical protein
MWNSQNQRLERVSNAKSMDSITPWVWIIVLQGHVCELWIQVSAVTTTVGRSLLLHCMMLLLLLEQWSKTTNFPLKHLLLNCSIGGKKEFRPCFLTGKLNSIGRTFESFPHKDRKETEHMKYFCWTLSQNSKFIVNLILSHGQQFHSLLLTDQFLYWWLYVNRAAHYTILQHMCTLHMNIYTICKICILFYILNKEDIAVM